MIDGVIKYNFDFQKTSALDESLFQEIEKCRKNLFKLGFIGEKDGIGYGNISQRIDKISFVITGTQTGHLQELSGEHYAHIHYFDDKKFYIKSSGLIKPSSEALTHGTIYNLSNKIGAVIHIHSNSLWKFMLANNYLKTIDVAYGSLEMIDDVNNIYKRIDPLKDSKLVMLGHEDGLLFFGENLQKVAALLHDTLKKETNYNLKSNDNN